LKLLGRLHLLSGHVLSGTRLHALLLKVVFSVRRLLNPDSLTSSLSLV
jgi:hypothetical protein